MLKHEDLVLGEQIGRVGGAPGVLQPSGVSLLPPYQLLPGPSPSPTLGFPSRVLEALPGSV